ncbi:TonB-dependent hemoglobin/transferrin/lactoferrin family receptor [Pseudomonas sp. R2.Fl]|nr:TonB-dependent hemoglobin/transferrin/lactoferrin family receptor [Pseudomonas sp. R2.Fl]
MAQTARVEAETEAQRSFSIPAQPLSAALTQFGRQSGLQVSFPADVVRGLRSNAVTGQFTAQQALDQLLRNTGVGSRITGQGIAFVGGNASADAGGGSVAGGDATVLDTIAVTAKGGRLAAAGSGYQGTPDWVYEEPASVSVVGRDAIQASGARDTRDLLANTAGVFVSGDNNQNQGVNVNIRGLQDQNRVATSIDGARQNFQRSGHGSTGYAYIDPSMVRAVEVEKSSTSGAGSAGALAGSVNFRTLVADDLIRDGERIGFETDATTGTNAYKFAGSFATAIRISDDFSVLGAISKKRLDRYDVGENGGNISTGSVDDPVFLGSDSWSSLLKTEMRPTDDTTLDLSWLRYRTEFAQGTDAASQYDVNNVTVDTLTASFGWDPDSELIDLKARLWYNRTVDEEDRSARTGVIDETFVDYTMETFGGTLENTSRFTLPVGELAVNYGVEAFRDLGTTDPSGTGIDTDPGEALWYSGANPSGRRDMISGFANATLEHDDWLTLSGGLRYDYYRLRGTSTVFLEPYTETITWDETVPGVCNPIAAPILALRTANPAAWNLYVNSQAAAGRTVVGDTLCYPPTTVTHSEDVTRYPTEDVAVDISGGALLPTAMAAFKPWDGVQIFGKYSEGFRPPTILEAVTGGSHVGSFGPGNAPNPWLEAETANTFEIGVNYSQDDVFQSGDSFRAKAVGFYREVQDYIALGTIDLTSGTTTTEYAAYVNLDGTTHMRGIELEGAYDAGRYYVGGSFTYLNADYASTYSYNGTSYNTGQYILFVPPTMKFTLDAGLRFFDEKLTLGGRVTHVGAADEHIGTMSLLLAPYETGDYTIYDIYGSYDFSENARLRFAVNNVTDVAYVPALGLNTVPAPGRTATISLNIRF